MEKNYKQLLKELRQINETFEDDTTANNAVVRDAEDTGINDEPVINPEDKRDELLADVVERLVDMGGEELQAILDNMDEVNDEEGIEDLGSEDDLKPEVPVTGPENSVMSEETVNEMDVEESFEVVNEMPMGTTSGSFVIPAGIILKNHDLHVYVTFDDANHDTEVGTVEMGDKFTIGEILVNGDKDVTDNPEIYDRVKKYIDDNGPEIMSGEDFQVGFEPDEEPDQYQIDTDDRLTGDLDETENSEEFVTHGYYTVSNSGGYEIMLSPSGDAAKVKDAYGSDEPKISDWLEIEYVPNEDSETLEMDAVIDPNGYNIPLNMVMRANHGVHEEEELIDEKHKNKEKPRHTLEMLPAIMEMAPEVKKHILTGMMECNECKEAMYEHWMTEGFLMMAEEMGTLEEQVGTLLEDEVMMEDMFGSLAECNDEALLEQMVYVYDKAFVDKMEKTDSLNEEKDGPCWKGYTQVGMKKKDGKEVPNCVPSDEVNEGGDSWMRTRAGAEGKIYEGVGGNHQDPTKEEMLNFLKNEWGGFEGYDKFAAEEAIYWYGYNHHGGQNSNLYSALSTSQYKPSRMMSNIEDSDDETSIAMYDTLTSKYGGEPIHGSSEDEPDWQDVSDYHRLTDPDGEDSWMRDEPLNESDMPKYVAKKGINVDNENGSNANDYVDQAMEKVNKSQETEQEKVEDFIEKKYEKPEEAVGETDVFRGKSPADVDFDIEPSDDYKERTELEMTTGDSRERNEEEVGEKANIGGQKGDPYTVGMDGKEKEETSSKVGELEVEKMKKRKEQRDNEAMYAKDVQPVNEDLNTMKKLMGYKFDDGKQKENVNESFVKNLKYLKESDSGLSTNDFHIENERYDLLDFDTYCDMVIDELGNLLPSETIKTIETSNDFNNDCSDGHQENISPEDTAKLIKGIYKSYKINKGIGIPFEYKKFGKQGDEMFSYLLDRNDGPVNEDVVTSRAFYYAIYFANGSKQEMYEMCETVHYDALQALKKAGGYLSSTEY